MSRRLPLLLLPFVVASCKHAATTSDTTVKHGPVDMPTEPVVVGGKVGDLPPPADALPLWSEIKKGVLPNGITYYVLPNHKPEKRAFLWLAVNAGSTSEDDDQRGLAHFDEHMALNGTAKYKGPEIINYLESIGMRFGADLNAYTNFDETVYQLEVPTDDQKFVDQGLDILHEWSAAVAYDPKEVDKERGVVLEEWRLGRGAGRRLFDKQTPVLFKGSRYAVRDTIGNPDTLKTAPRDTLHRFYQDFYRPDLEAVIAVGDFDPAAMEKEIQTKFGDLPKRATERAKPVNGVPEAKGTRVSIETDKEATGQGVAIYNLVGKRSRTGLADLRRLHTEYLYNQILDERFQTISRKADAPFFGAGGNIGGVVRDVDGFTRSASVKNGRVEDALRALLTEVIRLEKFGVTQTELDRAKIDLLRANEEEMKRESTRNSRSFASEITRNYFEREYIVGAEAEFKLLSDIIPKITLAEVNKAGASLGGTENRVIMITGPDGKPLPTQAQVLAIVDEVGKADVKPWEDKVSNEPLVKTMPKPGKVTAEKAVDKIGVTEWTLSNGARVIVKPTDFEADSVSMSGYSPGGFGMVSDKDYADDKWANQVVEVGGLGEFDRDSLQKKLTGVRASAGTSIGETSESVFASASPKDLETMFQLVYLNFTAPRKDPEQIGLWQTNSAERLKMQLASPDVQYQRQITDVMWKGNVRRKPADPGDFAKINVDKAFAFYQDRFADASDFTFVIVGEVDLAKLKPLVETYLASLPVMKRKTKDVDKDLGIRRPSGVVKKTIALGVEPKARVGLTFWGDEKWSRDNDRDMSLLGKVLSIRLREELREEKGGVYGVGAGGSIQRTPRHERTFGVNFGCAPDRVDELLKATFDMIGTIAKDGTTDDVIDKVKATFTRERETALRTNGMWSAWLMESYRYGDDPLLILDPAPALARMTNANLKAAAKKYADKKQYFLGVMTQATDAPKK